jgi:hypothetical protein
LLAVEVSGLRMSSWTLNSPPPARSGLNDARQWYGVGARGSSEGVLAGLLGGDGDSPPIESGLPRWAGRIRPRSARGNRRRPTMTTTNARASSGSLQ